MDEEDYVDEIMEELEVSGADDPEEDEEDDAEDSYEDAVGQLVEVGALEEVGARRVMRKKGKARARMLKGLLRKWRSKKKAGMYGKPSPAFGRSARDTERRAPLGFTEESSGNFFFTLAAAIDSTTTMRAKVSRVAHPNRLLIVPSAPGVVMDSIKVGDEEQNLADGAPVELYSTAALTDQLPDNFSPISSALDFTITLRNTTAVLITGTIGIKANVKR